MLQPFLYCCVMGGVVLASVFKRCIALGIRTGLCWFGLEVAALAAVVAIAVVVCLSALLL